MSNSQTILETERLLFRELTEDDGDALFAILGDSEVMEHYPSAFDEEMVKAWIHTNRERYRIFSFGLWAVVLKETGELIGDCGLTMQMIDGKIKPEIGYHIRKDVQKRGYGTVAAKAVSDWTFEHTPFKIIYSYMKYTNEGSYRTAIAAGMQLIAEFSDEINTFTQVYARIREEWEKRR